MAQSWSWWEVEELGGFPWGVSHFPVGSHILAHLWEQEVEGQKEEQEIKRRWEAIWKQSLTSDGVAQEF